MGRWLVLPTEDIVSQVLQLYNTSKTHKIKIQNSLYQSCMVDMKSNLKHVLEIGDGASDPKTKSKQGL